jgi:hypothetical protein
MAPAESSGRLFNDLDVDLNGLMMDIRRAPRDAQVAAFEKGLIPYIPADRENTNADP